MSYYLVQIRTHQDIFSHRFYRESNWCKVLPFSFLILIRKYLKIFYWNNFRWLPIDMTHIDRFSYKKFCPQNFLYAFRLITKKTKATPFNTKSRSELNQGLLFHYEQIS
ncbi:hypothetical protein DRM25_15960 [Salmonella enterica subsp. houtenae]|nr:hypothetical protein [Salmonella enterica subsp. houtenae]ECI4806492.1 hypothetical protein [Salmonella enterica subsp. houtenae]